jgi:hypothetical protein
VEILLLAVPPFVGYLVGRWWIVPTLGALTVAWAATAGVMDNYVGSCTRPDGCGAGPVAQVVLLGLLGAALIMALAVVGCLVRRKREGAS